MRKALIASGVNINKDECVHVLAKTASGLQTAIGNYYDNLWYIPEDNYKINEGRLRTVFTENNLKKATYILEGEFDENNRIVAGTYFQCFHVKSYRVQSGMIIYDLERDEWGNEIGHASIHDMVVTKCNRAISDGGTYPEPVAVKPCIAPTGFTMEDPITDIKTQTKWDIVFSASVTINTTTTGSEKTVERYLFRVTPVAVLTALYGSKDKIVSEYENSLLKACRCIGSIYKITGGTLAPNHPIAVDGIWIVPHTAQGNTGLQVTFKSPYLKVAGTDADEFSVGVWFNHVSNDFITLQLTDLPKETLINKKVYVGTKSIAKPLPRTIKQPNYQILFSYSAQGVTVTGKFGTENVDFTEDFKMPVLGDATDIGTLGRIANAVTWAGNVAKNLIRVTAGSTFWKGMGAAGLAQNVAQPFSTIAEKESINSNGDAIESFELQMGAIVGGEVDERIWFPFRYFAFESYENEQERAWREGADFNVNVSAKETSGAENQYIGMGYVTSCPHLGTTYYGAPEEDETYIRASVKVRGANSVASDFITSEFARGIYVKIYA